MILLISGATTTVKRYAASGRIGRLLRPGNGNLPDSLPWAADNGAFSGFDPVAFRSFLARIKGYPGCLWVAAPDVVANHAATLSLFREWEPELHAAGFPVAFILQDGATTEEIPWSSCEAVFIGGTTRFKLSRRAADLVAEGRERGKLCHMGRVNTKRRLRAAYQYGCDSVDGTSFSRWPDLWIPKGMNVLENLDRQDWLPLEPVKEETA